MQSLRFPLALFLFAFSVLIFSSCEKEPIPEPVPDPVDTLETDTTFIDSNPAAPGFDFENSDTAAIRIADSVMMAMGGRRAWDCSRYFKWSFTPLLSSTNYWIWDRWEGRVRHWTSGDDKVVLFNENTLEGEVYNGGTLVTDSAAAAGDIVSARDGLWNDSYWLFMPFKLKDDGVTLKYRGEAMQDGKDTYHLELTFAGVGLTPENKFDVYVEKSTWLVSYWKWYADAGDAVPLVQNTWGNYQVYGNILLSDDRGFFTDIGDLAIYSDDIPNAVFEDPVLPDLTPFEL